MHEEEKTSEVITKAQTMGNSRFEIRNSPPKPYYSAKRRFATKHEQAPSLKSAFTLTEMLVAVAMGAVLVAAAAGIFSLATQAVSGSQASTDVNNQLRVLRSWLDRDFSRIRLDGPLVIFSQEINYPLDWDIDGDGDVDANDKARADRIVFLASGDFVALAPPVPDFRSSLAVIMYGQDNTVQLPPANPTDSEMFDLVLTRKALLVAGDGTAGTNVDDVMPGSFADLLAAWYINGYPWDNWDNLDTPLLRPPPGGASNDELGRPNLGHNMHYTHMLSSVLSFRIVRYYMASTETEYSAAVAFGPADEKPAWIEFEIAMRDLHNQLTEDHISTYRVNLPSR